MTGQSWTCLRTVPVYLKIPLLVLIAASLLLCYTFLLTEDGYYHLTSWAKWSIYSPPANESVLTLQEKKLKLWNWGWPPKVKNQIKCGSKKRPCQNFDLDKHPITKMDLGLDPIYTNFSQAKHRFIMREYTEFFQGLKILDAKENKTDEEIEHVKKIKYFSPGLNVEERVHLMFTFDVFRRALAARNLTYFLASGSSVGATRHQGLIPWDEDIDVLLNASDWLSIRNVLASVPGFRVAPQRSFQWKFSWDESKYKHGSYNSPYIDIFFFQDDGAQMWSTLKHEPFSAQYTDVFPLRKQPFEGILADVPRKAEQFLSNEYGDTSDKCIALTFTHLKERYNGQPNTELPCTDLYDLYPFVFRKPSANNSLGYEEVLMVGEKELNTTIIDGGD